MSLSVRDDAHRPGVRRRARARAASSRTAANLARPAYLRMLVEIPRFHRRARRLLGSERAPTRRCATSSTPGGFSPYFRRHFMEPLVASVWSCDPDVALDYPARYLFSFLDHHGMLGVFGSPEWRTVTGGSRTYVERVGAAIARGPHRHQGDLGPRDRRRGRGDRRQRRGDDVRRRGDRDPPRSGAGDARRRRRRRSARSSARCPTPPTSPCCTPTTPCCPEAEAARASWNFRRPVDTTATRSR